MNRLVILTSAPPLQFPASIDDSQTLPAHSASLSMLNDIVTSTKDRVPQLACATGAGRTLPSAATSKALIRSEIAFFKIAAISFTASILNELITSEIAIWYVLFLPSIFPAERVFEYVIFGVPQACLLDHLESCHARHLRL